MATAYTKSLAFCALPLRPFVLSSTLLSTKTSILQTLPFFGFERLISLGSGTGLY